MNLVFHKQAVADVTDATTGHPWLKQVTFRAATRSVVGALQTSGFTTSDFAYLVTRINAAGGSVAEADLETVDCTAAEYAALDSALFDALRATQASALATRETTLDGTLSGQVKQFQNVGPTELVLVIPGTAAGRKKFYRALLHHLTRNLGKGWEATDGE